MTRPDTLTPQQRAALLASQARRIKAANLAHYQRMASIWQTPDYFSWQAVRQGLPRAAQVFVVTP